MCKEMSGFCDMSSSGAELLEQALSQADQYGTPARSQAQQPPRRVLRSNAQQLQDSPQILIPPSQPSLLSLQLQPSPPATVTAPPPAYQDCLMCLRDLHDVHPYDVDVDE